MPTHIDDSAVKKALSTVHDPELKRDLVSLGMVRDIRIEGSTCRLTIELTTPACPLKETIEEDIEKALRPLGLTSIAIDWTSRVRTTVSQPSGEGASAVLEGVRNVVLVASGKGGVGKSTVAANLALALALEGARVGLLDADIYGPSIPMMFGVSEKPSSPDGKHINPIRVQNIDLMSIGFFVAPNQAMIWRGPILNGTVSQFIRDVMWGELDYLIVDMPPGTGDVQLTISQQLKVSGGILVSTPQNVALADVIRAHAMFEQVKIPVLGVVENMSYFVCSNCSARHEIFSSGGGEAIAEQLGFPFLGALPLEADVRVAGDEGLPVVARAPDSPAARAFRDIARTLAGRLSVMALGSEGGKKKIFSKIFT